MVSRCPSFRLSLCCGMCLFGLAIWVIKHEYTHSGHLKPILRSSEPTTRKQQAPASALAPKPARTHLESKEKYGKQMAKYQRESAKPIKGPRQMTYLTAGAPPPRSTKVRYKFLPKPRLDTSNNATYGRSDLLHLEGLLGSLFQARPKWSLKTLAGVKRRIRKKAKKIKGRRWPKLVEEVKAIQGYMGEDFHIPLHTVQTNVRLLLHRHFPSTPRPMVCRSCFRHDLDHVIAPRGLCGPHGNVDVVAIVTSVPAASDARKAVRRTWGAYTRYNNFRLVFLFGSGWRRNETQALRAESMAHNDILMGNFKDDYFNLTYKVLMGFKWVLKECPKTKFIIRTADDCFVDVPRIFHLLNDFGNDESFQKHQIGRCFTDATPARTIGNKAYLSTMEYPYDLFPPYAVGTMYLTSSALTREIVRASVNVPYLPIEDAYVGLVLAYIGRGCHEVENIQGVYFQHSLTPKHMLLYTKKVKRSKAHNQ